MSLSLNDRTKQILIAILSGAGIGCLLLAGLWFFNQNQNQPFFAKSSSNFQPAAAEISIEEMMKSLPSPSALPSTLPTENIPQPSPNAYQSPTIANGGCLGGDRAFVTAETNNFLIYICGNDRPTNYVGIAKNGGGNILLPVSYSQDNRFTITNKNVTYILTSQDLTISQNGKTIQIDPIISYQKN